MYPGSFDPITNGHVDLVERSLKIFDEVIVVVAGNRRKSQKKGEFFTIEERVELIQSVFQGNDRVRVDTCEGLIMEYARKNEVGVVLRGLRAAGDFENEFMMASMNSGLNPEVETLFMVTGKDWFYVSSTIIKEVLSYGGDVSKYVSKQVMEAMGAKLP